MLTDKDTFSVHNIWQIRMQKHIQPQVPFKNNNKKTACNKE